MEIGVRSVSHPFRRKSPPENCELSPAAALSILARPEPVGAPPSCRHTIVESGASASAAEELRELELEGL